MLADPRLVAARELLGAALVTAFPYLLGFVSVDWRLLVQGVIIVVMIIYFPGGIVGWLRDFQHARMNRGERPTDDPVRAEVKP